jgi:hypothetical protein
MNDATEIGRQVVEILQLSGSKQRFIGVIDHYDFAGTTVFIRGDDNKLYLAFVSDMGPLLPGTFVTFRRDQYRAKEIQSLELEAESTLLKAA